MHNFFLLFFESTVILLHNVNESANRQHFVIWFSAASLCMYNFFLRVLTYCCLFATKTRANLFLASLVHYA
jgi:hypothetical protein